MTTLRKILIANRGEIACRIARTCRRMGIATVAVFSDADLRAPHVAAADEALCIGRPPSAESYLRAEAVLEAASRSGADAIHPGYGFLAENPGFARACADAGVVFIGPSAETIAGMGSKVEARRIAAGAGLPVIPGFDGTGLDDQALAERAAAEVGFPLMLKASLGGGGKGMRVVREEAALLGAIAAARRESLGAFGDDTLLVERNIDRPRHVEIQIFGDHHGQVAHLYERECSIQRRHQKIVEESPSTAVDDDLRARMGQAALKIAGAIGYQSAGTVEFILAPDRSFYFLEVNTRLQVEHPVTECLTGLDLVEIQIRIAEGARLGDLLPDPLPRRGAAIECRLYAEDPARDLLPSSGPILDWWVGAPESVRVDGGVEAGFEVGVHYDPLLAKIIARGRDRDEAVRKMLRGLRSLSVAGPRTNRDLLIRVLSHPAFLDGDTDTGFLVAHFAGEALGEPAHGPEAQVRAAVAAALFDHERRRRARPGLRGLPTGYRNNRFSDPSVCYEVEGQGPAGDGEGAGALEVCYRHLGGNRLRVVAPAGAEAEPVEVLRFLPPEIDLLHGDGRLRRYRVVSSGRLRHVHSPEAQVVLHEIPRFPERVRENLPGACVAPMPGTVAKVLVEPGQEVEAGAVLVIVEAMKMEHPVSAPSGGKVAEIRVSEGDQVESGALLVILETETPETEGS